MYSTCIYCHRSLGSNELVEAFPVGRRLAFDAGRGRLWAVCPHCGRWNLSPLEERWEAIEACERSFRDARRRVSTENVGLAHAPGGVELVRVGRPLRPELAAWRYGAELLRRRRGDFLAGVAAAGSGLGMIAATAGGLFVLGPVAAATPLVYAAGAVAFYRARDNRVVARANDGAALVRVRHLRSLRLAPGNDGEPLAAKVEADGGPLELREDDAARLLSVACVHANAIGGSRKRVREAVGRIEAAGDAASMLARAAEAGTLREVPYVDRLALEIALHEEAERRALEGELHRLEEAWREAEEIAAIADSLALPPSVGALMERLRGAR